MARRNHWLTPCGGCSIPHDKREMFTVDKPVSTGFAGYDPRAKTPTGGRMGVGGLKFRRFTKTERILVCARCSLGFKKATSPREMEFRERARPR